MATLRKKYYNVILNKFIDVNLAQVDASSSFNDTKNIGSSVNKETIRLVNFEAEVTSYGLMNVVADLLWNDIQIDAQANQINKILDSGVFMDIGDEFSVDMLYPQNFTVGFGANTQTLLGFQGLRINGGQVKIKEDVFLYEPEVFNVSGRTLAGSDVITNISTTRPIYPGYKIKSVDAFPALLFPEAPYANNETVVLETLSNSSIKLKDNATVTIPSPPAIVPLTFEVSEVQSFIFGDLQTFIGTTQNMVNKITGLTASITNKLRKGFQLKLTNGAPASVYIIDISETEIIVSEPINYTGTQNILVYGPFITPIRVDGGSFPKYRRDTVQINKRTGTISIVPGLELTEIEPPFNSQLDCFNKEDFYALYSILLYRRSAAENTYISQVDKIWKYTGLRSKVIQIDKAELDKDFVDVYSINTLESEHLVDSDGELLTQFYGQSSDLLPILASKYNEENLFSTDEYVETQLPQTQFDSLNKFSLTNIPFNIKSITNNYANLTQISLDNIRLGFKQNDDSLGEEGVHVSLVTADAYFNVPSYFTNVASVFQPTQYRQLSVFEDTSKDFIALGVRINDFVLIDSSEIGSTGVGEYQIGRIINRSEYSLVVEGLTKPVYIGSTGARYLIFKYDTETVVNDRGNPDLFIPPASAEVILDNNELRFQTFSGVNGRFGDSNRYSKVKFSFRYPVTVDLNKWYFAKIKTYSSPSTPSTFAKVPKIVIEIPDPVLNDVFDIAENKIVKRWATPLNTNGGKVSPFFEIFYKIEEGVYPSSYFKIEDELGDLVIPSVARTEAPHFLPERYYLISRTLEDDTDDLKTLEPELPELVYVDVKSGKIKFKKGFEPRRVYVSYFKKDVLNANSTSYSLKYKIRNNNSLINVQDKINEIDNRFNKGAKIKEPSEINGLISKVNKNPSFKGPVDISANKLSLILKSNRYNFKGTDENRYLLKYNESFSDEIYFVKENEVFLRNPVIKQDEEVIRTGIVFGGAGGSYDTVFKAPKPGVTYQDDYIFNSSDNIKSSTRNFFGKKRVNDVFNEKDEFSIFSYDGVFLEGNLNGSYNDVSVEQFYKYMVFKSGLRNSYFENLPTLSYNFEETKRKFKEKDVYRLLESNLRPNLIGTPSIPYTYKFLRNMNNDIEGVPINKRYFIKPVIETTNYSRHRFINTDVDLDNIEVIKTGSTYGLINRNLYDSICLEDRIITAYSNPFSLSDDGLSKQNIGKFEIKILETPPFPSDFSNNKETSFFGITSVIKKYIYTKTIGRVGVIALESGLNLENVLNDPGAPLSAVGDFALLYVKLINIKQKDKFGCLMVYDDNGNKKMVLGIFDKDGNYIPGSLSINTIDNKVIAEDDAINGVDIDNSLFIDSTYIPDGIFPIVWKKEAAQTLLLNVYYDANWQYLSVGDRNTFFTDTLNEQPKITTLSSQYFGVLVTTVDEIKFQYFDKFGNIQVLNGQQNLIINSNPIIDKHYSSALELDNNNIIFAYSDTFTEAGKVKIKLSIFDEYTKTLSKTKTVLDLAVSARPTDISLEKLNDDIFLLTYKTFDGNIITRPFLNNLQETFSNFCYKKVTGNFTTDKIHNKIRRINDNTYAWISKSTSPTDSGNLLINFIDYRPEVTYTNVETVSRDRLRMLTGTADAKIISVTSIEYLPGILLYAFLCDDRKIRLAGIDTRTKELNTIYEGFNLIELTGTFQTGDDAEVNFRGLEQELSLERIQLKAGLNINNDADVLVLGAISGTSGTSGAKVFYINIKNKTFEVLGDPIAKTTNIPSADRIKLFKINEKRIGVVYSDVSNNTRIAEISTKKLDIDYNNSGVVSAFEEPDITLGSAGADVNKFVNIATRKSTFIKVLILEKNIDNTVSKLAVITKQRSLLPLENADILGLFKINIFDYNEANSFDWSSSPIGFTTPPYTTIVSNEDAFFGAGVGENAQEFDCVYREKDRKIFIVFNKYRLNSGVFDLVTDAGLYQTLITLNSDYTIFDKTTAIINSDIAEEIQLSSVFESNEDQYILAYLDNKYANPKNLRLITYDINGLAPTIVKDFYYTLNKTNTNYTSTSRSFCLTRANNYFHLFVGLEEIDSMISNNIIGTRNILIHTHRLLIDQDDIYLLNDTYQSSISDSIKLVAFDYVGNIFDTFEIHRADLDDIFYNHYEDNMYKSSYKDSSVAILRLAAEEFIVIFHPVDNPKNNKVIIRRVKIEFGKLFWSSEPYDVDIFDWSDNNPVSSYEKIKGITLKALKSKNNNTIHVFYRDSINKNIYRIVMDNDGNLLPINDNTLNDREICIFNNTSLGIKDYRIFALKDINDGENYLLVYDYNSNKYFTNLYDESNGQEVYLGQEFTIDKFDYRIDNVSLPAVDSSGVALFNFIKDIQDPFGAPGVTVKALQYYQLGMDGGVIGNVKIVGKMELDQIFLKRKAAILEEPITFEQFKSYVETPLTLKSVLIQNVVVDVEFNFIDCKLGNVYWIDRAINNNAVYDMINVSDGAVYYIFVRNNATNYDFISSAHGDILWPNDIQPTKSATNKVDLFMFVKIKNRIFGSYGFNYAF